MESELGKNNVKNVESAKSSYKNPLVLHVIIDFE